MGDQVPVRWHYGLAALCAMIAAGSASTASADNFADHGVDLVGTRLDVVVSGKILPRCEIHGGGQIDFGELTGGKRAQGALALDCNVPFEVSLVSQNGGLAHQGQPRGEGPYSGNLAYDVELDLPTVSPEAGSIQARFHSRNRQLSVSSGEGISAGVGRIQFVTRDPEGAGLLAGQYSEVLTVNIAPRV